MCGVISVIIREEHGIQHMPCLSQSMLPEIHTMENVDFRKSIIHFQVI